MAVLGYLPNLLKKNMAFASSGSKKTALIVSHLDDDVVFFLPWLDYVDYVIIASLPGTFGHLEVIKNYTERYNAVWQFAGGIVSFEEYRDIWLDPVGRHELITEESYDLILRDLVANPEIDEIFTHNPWGEYGHLHAGRHHPEEQGLKLVIFPFGEPSSDLPAGIIQKNKD